MLEHGGNLREASVRYSIPLAQWLDLSTGINPHAYVPPAIPRQAWARLPEEQDGLEQAAVGYFGTAELLPLPGSQAAIQALPSLRGRSMVGVLAPAYAEHAHAWRKHGHIVRELSATIIEEELNNLDVLVLSNPNNPTGESFAPAQLQAWHARLAARGGWLVVDEAFMEASLAVSMSAMHMPPGLIVLRSLGKFFGLAGARVGFLLAHAELRAALREQLGPWGIAGPARHVAQAALRDMAWQNAMRERLAQEGMRLRQLMTAAGLPPQGGCSLFQWVQSANAPALHEQLARQGILTRLFAAPPSLRLGLPGSEAEWLRLQDALQHVEMAA